MQEQQARAFDFEEDTTEVVDVEPLVSIAMPRVATKDLIVHVMTDDGCWHRLHPSTVKTSCGYPINYYRAVSRQERRIEHPLATVRPDGKACQCWTDEERDEADNALLGARRRRETEEREAEEFERQAQKRQDEFSAEHKRETEKK